MNTQNKATKAASQVGGVVHPLNQAKTLLHSIEPAAPALSLEEQAQQIQAQKEALQEQENELELKMQQAQEQEQARKLEEYNNLREDATGFRATAAKETDEESKRLYVQWALDADKQANQLARELGLAIEEPEDIHQESKAVKAVGSLLKHRLGAVVQISLLLLAIWVANHYFNSTGEHIKEVNKVLPVEQQMSAYDETSVQKFFFEKWVEFWDLPVGLFKLLIMVPFVAFYMLPFIRSRKDFFTEFFEDLTPYQRCLLTLSFIALFVLHSALTHGVKP
ncbi:hypothetical protein GO730_05695 [Spirosoma sp. HMF3257]|uniref:Uncharacterized protein n=1 Tax=Spirosoma telluris TaxID=2183553 RepID=A0A327NI35_9BACT|nr:hypothetical protein [Spirosoma telluris]RAI73969.1 hypothetical protein HMF3257_05655 [Spirosoma telluris]